MSHYMYVVGEIRCREVQYVVFIGHSVRWLLWSQGLS